MPSNSSPSIIRPGSISTPTNACSLRRPIQNSSCIPCKGLRPPVAAKDHRGADVLSVLQKIDDEWYDGFKQLDIHGYAEDYALELEFGRPVRIRPSGLARLRLG